MKSPLRFLTDLLFFDFTEPSLSTQPSAQSKGEPNMVPYSTKIVQFLSKDDLRDVIASHYAGEIIDKSFIDIKNSIKDGTLKGGLPILDSMYAEAMINMIKAHKMIKSVPDSIDMLLTKVGNQVIIVWERVNRGDIHAQ